MRCRQGNCFFFSLLTRPRFSHAAVTATAAKSTGDGIARARPSLLSPYVSHLMSPTGTSLLTIHRDMAIHQVLVCVLSSLSGTFFRHSTRDSTIFRLKSRYISMIPKYLSVGKQTGNTAREKMSSFFILVCAWK